METNAITETTSTEQTEQTVTTETAVTKPRIKLKQPKVITPTKKAKAAKAATNATAANTKKSVRRTGERLLATIKSAIPGAGYVRLRPEDSSRATFQFRSKDYEVTHNLACIECGFGVNTKSGRAQTPESMEYGRRLKASAVNA